VLAFADTVDRTTAIHRRSRADPDAWCTSTNARDADPAGSACRCDRPGHTTFGHARRGAVNDGLGGAGPERNRHQRRQHRQRHTCKQSFCSVRHFYLYWSTAFGNDPSITAAVTVADTMPKQFNT